MSLINTSETAKVWFYFMKELELIAFVYILCDSYFSY